MYISHFVMLSAVDIPNPCTVMWWILWFSSFCKNHYFCYVLANSLSRQQLLKISNLATEKRTRINKLQIRWCPENLQISTWI